MQSKILCALLSIFVLCSCAETQLASHVAKSAFPNQNQGTFKVGNPYEVEGRTYVPTETYTYTETGIASWYGPGFDGKHTANGEKFDKDELTAAHRTLQMPSLVRVTNLDNGRSLIVRINDRGPFKRGRVIDVSQRAAELLGFKGIGTAKVRLDLLADESKAIAMAARQGRDTSGMEVTANDPAMRGGAPLTQGVYQQAAYTPQSAATPDIPGHVREGQFFPDPIVKQYAVHSTNIYVQAGSFSNQANAANLAESLRGVAPARVFPANINGRQLFRVRLGPVPDVNEADQLLARLASTGHKESIIVVE